MSAHSRGDGPPVFNTSLGKGHENGAAPLVGAAAAQAALHQTPGKRNKNNRRGSVSQIYPSDSTQGTLPPYDEYQPKAFSMANYPQDTLRKLAAEDELDAEAIAEEIIKLLEEEKPLDEDILGAIITGLRIPAASSSTPPSAKEVLFPAHLISLITNEMWKYGMLRESERFLANVMQTVQQHVMVGGFADGSGAFAGLADWHAPAFAEPYWRSCHCPRHLLVVERARNPLVRVHCRERHPAGHRTGRGRRRPRV
jgi:myosin-5